MANFPTSISTDANLYVAANNVSTTLSSGIGNADTSLSCASAASFPTTGVVLIESEICFYTGKTASTLTGLTRGADGTSAASHSASKRIDLVYAAKHHNGIKDEIIAIETALTMTASRAVVTSASGIPTTSSVTSTEVGYLSGVKSAIQTQIDALFPSGSLIMWGGAAAPSGYLLADGSAVSRTTYAGIFTAYGTTFGIGDGSTTFNLPDFRGVFPKGAGTTNRAAGKDANGNYYAGTLGTYATDKMQGHKHTLASGQNPLGDSTGKTADTGSGLALGNASTISAPSTDGTNGTPRTGMTTEPQSLGITFIIKI